MVGGGRGDEGRTYKEFRFLCRGIVGFILVEVDDVSDKYGRGDHDSTIRCGGWGQVSATMRGRWKRLDEREKEDE